MGRWVLCGWLMCCAVPLWAAEFIVEFSTRPDVVQTVLVQEAADPVGVVVLFPGGHGRLGLARGEAGPTLDWGRNNFLVRSRAWFVQEGYTVVLVDAPSDRRGEDGMFGGFRVSADHMTDLRTVLDWSAARYGKPIWLVGTSRGTESAAALGRYAGDRIRGVVLSAPITRPSNRGVSLLEMPLQDLRTPVLLVAHRADGCRTTPPEGVEELELALVGVMPVAVQWWEGGDAPQGNPCQGLTPHGFVGLEAQVVRAMAQFMRDH